MAANSYSCNVSNVTGKLTISTSDANNTFHIWPEEYLAHGLWDPLNSASIPDYIAHDNCYDVLGIHGPNTIAGSQNSPVVGTSHINVVPYHTLYIHSSLGSQAHCVGPMGSSSVIRAVCLDQPPGRYVHDRCSLPFDYVTVDEGMIRQLDIQLTDWRDRPVPLTNSWSFSIIFVPEDEM